MQILSLLLSAVVSFLSVTPLFPQNLEITGHAGGQLNGGLDLSTSLFRRIEVANSPNYGVSAGYLLGDHYGIEFQWNYTTAGTFAEPLGGGTALKVFSLNQNQYMGNLLLHFKDRQAKVRPFGFLGLGATDLTTNRDGVSGKTRFAFALGGGAKYNFSKYLGVRGQAKWSPTYITSTKAGYWCDPFWGGCWTVGTEHYLHEFDLSAGLTLRF